MADQLIFVRKKPIKPTLVEKVIKVDGDMYNEVVKVASEAGISIQRAASTMIGFAAERVNFVDEDDFGIS